MFFFSVRLVWRGSLHHWQDPILSHSSLPFDSGGWLPLFDFLETSLSIFPVLPSRHWPSSFLSNCSGKQICILFIKTNQSHKRFDGTNLYISPCISLLLAWNFLRGFRHTHTELECVSPSFFFFSFSLFKCRHPLFTNVLRAEKDSWKRSHLAALTASFTFVWWQGTHKDSGKKKENLPVGRLKFAYTVASTRRDCVVIPARCREITSGQQRNGRATHCVVLNHQGMTQSRRTGKEMKTSTVSSDLLFKKRRKKGCGIWSADADANINNSTAGATKTTKTKRKMAQAG